MRRWAVLSGAAVVLVAVPAWWSMRWLERTADEVMRLLGHGPAGIRYFEWIIDRAVAG